MPERRPSIDHAVKRRVRQMHRAIGTDIERLRVDEAASIAAVAGIAGLDRSFVGRIEAGSANPSLESLAAISIALGADVSIRFFAGTGPRLTDRHQARMIETLLGQLAEVWRPHLEVPVSRPVRGVIDLVLEREDARLFVASEAHSALARLEQQIRWSAEKAGALESSSLTRPGSDWAVSRLLILRSTTATRDLARTFEATLRTAYPAPTHAAVEALVAGADWPGDAIVRIRIEGDRVDLLDGPPRGVAIGR